MNRVNDYTHGGAYKMNISGAQRGSMQKPNAGSAPINKGPGLAAWVQTIETRIPDAFPEKDMVDISAEAKNKSIDFQKMLDDLRNEMQALREGLKQAREAGEGAAQAWKERIKCLQIAMRIMSGDIVPEEDHRYLREKDMELYSRAIQLRIVKEDPEEYDRLSDDDDKRNNKASDALPDAAPPMVNAPAAAGAQPAEASPPPADG